MKAIRIHNFGDADVLKYEDVPEPRPGTGEMRIRIIAAGVNPVDWKIRRGMTGQLPLPMTLGLDVAGLVDMLGPDVRNFQPGDAVFGKATREHGGYAEYTVLEAATVARKPDSLSFVDAAAIPTAGLTAWQALFDKAGLMSEQTILIHGAAGGVGGFAVQFAKWKGAQVIGTATGEGIAFAKSLGADEVIDYRTQRFEEIVHDADVVLDTIGGDTQARSWSVLKAGGFLVTTVGLTTPEEAEAHGVRATGFRSWTDSGELTQIAELIVQGHVQPMVTTVLPLTAAMQAQQMSESGHVHGKIILRVAEEPGQRTGQMAA